MNIDQVNMLEDNGYEVLPELGFVRDLKNDRPYVHISFNKYTKKFELGIVSIVLSGDDNIQCFKDYLSEKAMLILALNNLS